MIEHLLAAGMSPGRAWAVSLGRHLVVRNAANPKQVLARWGNHVAPTLTVSGVEGGIVVIDPSTQTTPVGLSDWGAAFGARECILSTVGLSVAQLQHLQADRVLRGEPPLDAVLFSLPLGLPPVLEQGGSGFRIDADPPEGPSAFARREMLRLLALQNRPRARRPDEL